MIEKLTKSKKGSLGYTLTELLAVIGILAVLCAIAIPSIITISRALKFRQRNDYAKTIFLAAQENLSEMRSDGSLGMLQGSNIGPTAKDCSGFPNESWADQYVYVTGNDTARYSVVLPVNSVESTLRNQQVIIEYNPYTGNVYSVFYSEEAESIYSRYSDPGTGLPRTKSDRRKIMLGYYDGSGLPNQELELQQTKAELEFRNGEEGLLAVKIPVPDEYYTNLDDFTKGLSVTLTVTGDMSGNSFIVPVMTYTPESDEAEGSQTFALSSLSTQEQPPAGSTITIPVKEGEVATETELGNTVVVLYTMDSLVDYGSFANKVMVDQNLDADSEILSVANGDNKHLTEADSESDFFLLPGENVTVTAQVTFTAEGTAVDIESGILPGVNPLFEYLEPGSAEGKYVLAVSNGRNLQNLNVLTPSIAANVETVVFTEDVDWNETVKYYNEHHGTTESGEKVYCNTMEAPARCLPYFVPINNGELLGSSYFGPSVNDPRPTLQYSHDVDTSSGSLRPVDHADIVGNNFHVIGLNIDATKYANQTAFGLSDGYGEYYVSNDYTVNEETVQNYQQVDYSFTGLFAYVNTYIDGLNVVNPIVKGHPFSGSNNPATGALLGASGFNSLVTNCGVYIDKGDANYKTSNFRPYAYSADEDQTWYGVSGQGAVGGLVGYAKSHRTASGDLTDNASELAFSYCFAAVPVSGDMRGNAGSPYGYSNGVGGFIGNSTLTNFYSCYSSGKVYATGCYVKNASERESQMITGIISGIIDKILPSNVLINNLMKYDGYYSMGTGGFVGTSHGTRYTNCFTTGDVNGYCASSEQAGVGGFVGVMSFDERFTYSAGGKTQEIRQLTVFDSCYSTGKATIQEREKENFSGANARILKYDGSIYADYYELLAPYYATAKTVPSYPSSFSNDLLKNATYYIYKDSYYLSRNYEANNAANIVSNQCASVVSYDVLTNLAYNHSYTGKADENDSWLDQRLYEIGTYYKLDHFSNWLSGIGLSDISDIVSFNEPSYIEFFGNKYVSYVLEGKGILGTIIDSIFNPDRLNGCNYWQNVLTDVYIGQLREGFQSEDWRTANTTNTHPYTMSGSAYPFSKLIDMPYYGDWPTQPQAAGIAYYEDYLSTDGTEKGIFFDSEDTSTLKNSSEMEGFKLVSDGYAILTVSENDQVWVKVGSGDYKELTPIDNFHYAPGGANAYNVYQGLFPLTKEILDKAAEDVTAEQFYAKLSVKVISENAEDKEADYVFYFNPNVAKSTINPAGGKEANEPESIPEQISIRTARQLAALSTAPGSWAKSYGTEENLRDYRYIQELDINYASYQASSYSKTEAGEILSAIADAQPIGNAENPFNASYNGYNGITAQTRIARDVPDGEKAKTAPLFGVIGENGILQNLIVKSGISGKNVSLGAEDAESIGIVTNVMNGTLQNVDLTLAGPVSVTAEENAGLLAGTVSGELKDCDVTCKAGSTTSEVQTSLTAVNVGGAVGSVSGKVTGCSILAQQLQLSGTNCGGFAGSSSGSAENVTVSLADITTAGSISGGYAGVITGITAEDSTVQKGAINNGTVTLSGSNQSTAADGIFGGFAGSAENAQVFGSSVELQSGSILKAPTAAGFVGNAKSGLGLESAKVNASGSITGTDSAAGFAGSMEQGSKITACNAAIGGAVSAPKVAGFAVTVAGSVDRCFTTLNAGTIIGTKETAAGFADTVSATGNIFGAGGSGVVGSGSITATSGNAAGFAVTVQGNVAAGRVTPAYAQNRKAYLASDTGYNSLRIAATSGTAAGFAVTVEQSGTVVNCDALGTLSGEAVSCFANVNAGTVSGCMANVMVPQSLDCRFVKNNTGVISDSYGWFGDGATTNLANFEVGGTCTGSYFGDLDVMADENSTTPSIVVYASNGSKQTLTPAKLEENGASSLGASWSAAGSFTAYPFSQSLRGNYPYPMLRPHSGDWAATAQYAYGVIYYEQYEDGSLSYHIADLSDPTYTVEDELLNKTVEFKSTGTITNAGYAIFCHSKNDVVVTKMDGTVIPNAIGDPSNIPAGINPNTSRYSVYPLNAEGQVIVFGAVETIDDEETSGDVSAVNGEAKVVTWFADAINVGTGESYQIRTGEQFSNIRHMSGASFKQTHNLTLSTGYTTIDTFSGVYDGNGCTVSAESASRLIGTVSGTVQNTAITLGSADSSTFKNVSSTFGTVSGIVRNNTISMGYVNVTDATFGVVASEVAAGGQVIDNEVTGLSVKVTGTAASTIGGIAGTNAGSISGGSVDVIINYTAVNSGSAALGGIAGTNAGTIGSASEADAVSASGVSAGKTPSVTTINYTPASGDSAMIGGLVGRMDDGSTIQDVTADGAVNLRSVTEEKSNAETERYIIGGAIGKDAGTVCKYSDIESSVTVSLPSGMIPENPGSYSDGYQDMSIHGPVGMFVGYVGTGSFANCSSTAANETYQFLGRVAITAGGPPEGITNGAWFTHSVSDKKESLDGINTLEKLEAFANEKGFEKWTEGAQYYVCGARLNNCTFCYGGKTYTQSIDTEYFYLGELVTVKDRKQLTAAVMDKYEKVNERLTYNQIYDGIGTDIETEYYYPNDSGDYDSVSVDVDYRWYNYQLQYQYTFKTHEKTFFTSEWVYYYQKGNPIGNGNVEFVLYRKLDNPKLPDGKYLITNNPAEGESYYMFDGSAAGVQVTIDTSNVLTAKSPVLWTKSDRVWKKDISGSKATYLYLAGKQLTESSSNKIKVSEYGDGFSLLGANNNRRLGKYLFFNNGYFGVTTDLSSVLLWKLEELADIQQGTLTRKDMTNSTCVGRCNGVDLIITPADTASETVSVTQETPQTVEALLPTDAGVGGKAGTAES